MPVQCSAAPVLASQCQVSRIEEAARTTPSTPSAWTGVTARIWVVVGVVVVMVVGETDGNCVGCVNGASVGK